MSPTTAGFNSGRSENAPLGSLASVGAVLSESVDTRAITPMSDREVVELTLQAEALGRQIDALRVQLAGEIDVRARSSFGEESLARQLGCCNPTELLRRLTLVSAGTAAKRFALARVTRGEQGFSGSTISAKFPAVAAALETAAISVESAELITKSLGSLPGHVDPDDFAHAEQCLVAAACGTAPPDGMAATAEHADNIRVMCRPWVASLDQDGPEPSFTEQQMRRFFTFGHEKNGLVPVRGSVSPEVAALIGRMFDAINSPRVRDVAVQAVEGVQAVEVAGSGGEELAASSSGSGSSGVRFVAVEADDASSDPSNDPSNDPFNERILPTDLRSPGQKRHDALAAIAQAASQQDGMPTLGGAAVTVLIQVEEEQLLSRNGTGWLHGHDGAITPISIAGVEHAACSGNAHRVVQNSDGRIIELGNNQRVFTAHQRRAIAIRDGGCVVPGCTTPATWCEIHHVTEHSAGGATHTDNGVTLCWFHHRSLETSGWEVRMTDGTPEILAPEWLDHSRTWRAARPPSRPPGIDRLRRKAS